jgi:hypothetical protein
MGHFSPRFCQKPVPTVVTVEIWSKYVKLEEWHVKSKLAGLHNLGNQIICAFLAPILCPFSICRHFQLRTPWI